MWIRCGALDGDGIIRLSHIHMVCVSPQYESDRLRVRLVDVSNYTNTYEELTPTWDLSVASLVWEAPYNGTSTRMYLNVEQDAQDVLYTLDLVSRTQPQAFAASVLEGGCDDA